MQKNSMHQSTLDYLKTQRVGVLALQMPDGSPHAATLHYAHTQKPVKFFFETSKESFKGKAILNKKITEASFVVGSDESNMKTLQLDGFVQLLKDSELKDFNSIYLGKFPEKKAKTSEPHIICFTFTPTWWRFTDWTTTNGKLIITSED